MSSDDDYEIIHTNDCCSSPLRDADALAAEDNNTTMQQPSTTAATTVMEQQEQQKQNTSPSSLSTTMTTLSSPVSSSSLNDHGTTTDKEAEPELYSLRRSTNISNNKNNNVDDGIPTTTTSGAEATNAADDDNNNSNSTLVSVVAGTTNTPRQRRFLLVEKIRNNRKQHIMKLKNNNGIKRRLLLEDYYRVEPIVPPPVPVQPEEQQSVTAIPEIPTTPTMPTTLRRRNIPMSAISAVSSATKTTKRRLVRFLSKGGTTVSDVDVAKAATTRFVVLPGVPKYEADWARDSHDFFNLVVLVPLVALNVLNWNWDLLLDGTSTIIWYKYRYWCTTLFSIFSFINTTLFGGDGSTNIISNNNHLKHHHHNTRHTNELLQNQNIHFMKLLKNSWTGELFDYFFMFAVTYFIIDLIWVYIVPQAVRSPSTIIQHHIATLLYIIIPYYYMDCRWCMGACMSVEINTWFLIARRVFNKQGFPPWTIVDLSFFSIRIKLISILFYITWILIRVMLYPSLLIPFYDIWVAHSIKVHTKLNLICLCIPLHSIFCLLNIKWTYELLMSKIRYWKRLYQKNNHTNNSRKGIPTIPGGGGGGYSNKNNNNYYYYYDNNKVGGDESKGL